MSKKLLFLISFVLVLALVNSVSAQGDPNWPAAYWSGFGDGISWGNANNWYSVDVWWDEVNFPTVPARIWQKVANAVPDADTIVFIGQGAPWYEYPAALAPAGAVGNPVISGENAVCYQIYISTGPSDTNGPGRLDVTAGTLTSRVYSDDWLGMMIGFVPDGNGIVNLSGGDILCDNYDGEGGLLAVGGWNYEDPDANGGIGTLNMTGGTLTCYHMDVPESDAPDPCTTIGYINLHGGTFYTSADEDWTEFWMGDVDQFPLSRIDVTDGIAQITSHDENELWWINLWIDQGKITAFGGTAPRAELYKDYNITNAGKTTLQAIATELEQAWQPKPRPGQTIDYRPTLTWAPGDDANTYDPNTHVVYFSTDRDAVVNGTAPNTPKAFDANNYDPGILDWTTNYYWRIDEANDPCEWPGLVWNFKTDDHLAVDDMDLYGPDPALRNVWKDYTTGTLKNNGAELFVETDPAFVRSRQSMRYYFRNRKVAGGYTGSEAEASAALLEIGTDWVSGDPCALVLYFLGDLTNLDDTSGVVGGIHQDQMYVAVEDGDGNVGIVKYDQKYGYDMNDIKGTSWQDWNIDLQDPCLTGVNLADVAKVYIGFGGQKIGQTALGAGGSTTLGDTVWFDDIGLYPIRCVPKYGPATDVTYDCITDYQELEILAGDWLKSGYDILAVPPSIDPNRLVRYTFDTEGGSGDTVYNTDTTLGSAADGTVFDTYSHGPGGPLTWETPGANHPDVCEPNYCIQLSAYDEQAVIMDSNLNGIVGGGFTTNHLTITCWVKRGGDQLEWTGMVFSSSELPSDDPMPHAGLSLGANDDWMPETAPALNHLAYHWENCPDANDATPDGEDQIWWWRSGLLVPDNEWTFCAVAVEPEQATMYMMVPGGDLYSSVNIETHVPATFEDPFNIGRDPRILWGSRTLLGQIDDVQIYDYALSDVEILYVAQAGGGTHVALVSLVDFDDSDDIDFFDYVDIANNWFVEKLWPLR